MKIELEKLYLRKEIPVYTKILKNKESYLVNSKIEKLYDYYVCDYCGEEIKLDKKQYERTGGIVNIPRTITKRKDLKLVIHNKCLKPVLKEFK